MKRRTHLLVLAVLGVGGMAAAGVGCKAEAKEKAAGGSAPATQAAAQVAPATQPAMSTIAQLAGHWTGTSHIVVQWATQKQLPLDLKIAPDGSVTGTVGDARLVDARLHTSRNNFERSLGWGCDWRIDGKLDGELIQAEQIHRAAIIIVFDESPGNGTLVGGVNSSGSKFGGKEHMILTAQKLTLRRAAE